MSHGVTCHVTWRCTAEPLFSATRLRIELLGGAAARRRYRSVATHFCRCVRQRVSTLLCVMQARFERCVISNNTRNCFFSNICLLFVIDSYSQSWHHERRHSTKSHAEI